MRRKEDGKERLVENKKIIIIIKGEEICENKSREKKESSPRELPPGRN